MVGILRKVPLFLGKMAQELIQFLSMRIVIVDDEPFARDELRFLIEQHSDCQIIGEAEDGPGAVQLIESTRPDIVFLDIQMPGINGFEVLRALHLEHLPQFVFVTAYDQYAVRAFDVSATDYVLKPVAEDRLGQALERCRRQLQPSLSTQASPSLPHSSSGAPSQLSQIQSLLAALPPRSSFARQVVGRKNQRLFILSVDELVCLEMESQLLFLVTEKERYWSNETLTDLLNRLDPEQFIRVHRQAAVRLSAVRELSPLSNERMLLRLSNGHEVSASRNYLPDLKNRLGLK